MSWIDCCVDNRVLCFVVIVKKKIGKVGCAFSIFFCLGLLLFDLSECISTVTVPKRAPEDKDLHIRGSWYKAKPRLYTNFPYAPVFNRLLPHSLLFQIKLKPLPNILVRTYSNGVPS